MMELVVGTYNHVLIGIRFTHKDKKEEWEFSPRFTDQGHDGCIKCVASCGKYLASGSTDEVIRLYDMKKNIDLGSLVQQNGTITDLTFCGKTHLLSGSGDGTISIWECKTWECIKILKGHRDAVNSISVHPSGRLALSLSKDKTIRVWNLVTGRSAYTTKIRNVGVLIIWSPSGESYAVASETKVSIYKLSDSSETCCIACPKAVLSMDFISEDIIVLGGESEEVIVYDIGKNNIIQSFKAHENRVKALKTVRHPENEKLYLIFSLSSNGYLRAWEFDTEDIQKKPISLAEIHVPGRPVCLAVISDLTEKK